MRHSYQLKYRHVTSGANGIVIVPTLAMAEKEKCRLEALNNVVTAVVAPDWPITVTDSGTGLRTLH
jgi:hypothetical protein